jgi:hypothetical protein
MLTGVSGGTTSVDPSRSSDSEVSPVRASGYKRAEYRVMGRRTTEHRLRQRDGVPTVVWSCRRFEPQSGGLETVSEGGYRRALQACPEQTLEPQLTSTPGRQSEDVARRSVAGRVDETGGLKAVERGPCREVVLALPKRATA